ncbi:MAG: efflux RND transporter periplasmic adaptor subunit [Chloroflexaceae bacterium]|nr:efflux RND transporter periplasmic adaptor subunit [Chloroflexaceae bacterium]
MTTTTKSPRRGRWIAAGVVVIIVAIVVALVLSMMQGGTASGASTTSTTSVTRGGLVASVSGSGSIAADQSLNLSFKTSGTVTEVLVEEGNLVKAGQALAKIDDRDLQLQVAIAQTSVETAQARLKQAQEGNSKPEDIAAARASLANAQAQYTRTRTGNITAADIASAEAQLRSAQAKLNDLKAGAKPEQVSSAQAKLEQALANLESQRNSLSTAKTRAESQLEQAANTLRDRQADYSRIYWENKELADRLARFGQELPQSNIDNEAAALRAVQSAEESLQQSQLAFDQAKQAEITGLASAESQVRDAQEQLRVTQQGATEVEIIQAQATVDQAAASLQKLRQGGTQADIAAAGATIAQAQANLDKLTAPATATDLEIQQASLAQAQQQLEQAKLQLDNATLKAPFDGIVSTVSIVPGSAVSNAVAAIVLIDRSPLHVDLRLSENDVARVQQNQEVALTVDALRGWQTTGQVNYIAPAAETSNGVVTYRVRVTFPDVDETVKVGMTANLDIVTARKDNVLLVPNSALLPKGTGRVVQVPNGEDGVREVEVEIGLSSSDGKSDR